MPKIPLTVVVLTRNEEDNIAFFLGRTVSYSIYVFTAAGLKATSLGDAFRDAITSPWGIALQVLMLIGLFLLARLPWATWLGKKVYST